MLSSRSRPSEWGRLAALAVDSELAKQADLAMAADAARSCFAAPKYCGEKVVSCCRQYRDGPTRAMPSGRKNC